MTGTKRGQWVVFETRRTFQVTEYTPFPSARNRRTQGSRAYRCGLPEETFKNRPALAKDGAPVGQLCLVGLTQSSHKLA